MFEEIKSKIKELSLKQKILIIISIVILIAATIIYVNPSKRLRDLRSSQRRADMAKILDAVYQYSLENGGKIPETITSTPTEICKTDSSSCEGLVDLSIISKKYLPSVPKAPQTGDSLGVGYLIFKTATGRITVSISGTKDLAPISITR